jgi:hypothetical protein
MGDLQMLESRGRGALEEQPKILSQTARSIVARVLRLREINRQYPGIAFTTLGQFVPFLKYADHPAEALAAGPVHLLKLPVEPDMGFSSTRLSRREFWERLSAIRERHEAVRAELGVLLDIAAQIVRGLGAGPVDAVMLERLNEACGTISALAAQAIQSSEYLKTSFYGVSMVPTASLARACAGAEPAQPAAPSAAGLSGYYAIQESLLYISKCKRFPGAKASEGGPHQHWSFWRQ